MERVLGLDVGGANLKAAHTDGTAVLRPFALWKQPSKLGPALRELLRSLPAFDRLAVTMTGELCDCFETKRQGVAFILDAVEAAADRRPVAVWVTEGQLATAEEARACPLRAAAGNWHALATFAGRFASHGPALVVDVGSTTTDLIPLHGGKPVPRGLTDAERLGSGELVYTGVRRTPVCALLRGGVAAEVFATTLDVYLLLGRAAEDDGNDTADGRPATRPCARARLARMLGGDAETCARAEVGLLAARAARAQERLVREAFRRVVRRLKGPPRAVVLAGSGEFLARRVLHAEAPGRCRVISLARRLGPAASGAACAHAVAVLAAEGRHG
jgi:probable H4MPT-linked C1 transfer pathway protein